MGNDVWVMLMMTMGGRELFSANPFFVSISPPIPGRIFFLNLLSILRKINYEGF